MKQDLKYYPRPQLQRNSFINLNGKWDFTFDKNNDIFPGKLDYEVKFKKQYDINVPFAYQSKLSGIDIQEEVNSVWYHKQIEINKKAHKRYILHFEGADYVLRLFVNKKYVGNDTGAYHRMSFDITKYLKTGLNDIVVNCNDSYSISRPRGKQRWHDSSFECFYIDTTGIYKPVWIEEVNNIYITNLKLTPLYEEKRINCLINVNKANKPLILEYEISFKGNSVLKSSFPLKKVNNVNIDLPSPIHEWDVNKGNLYDINFKILFENEILDDVDSYFGIRKLHIKNRKIYLNNKELYQKLVLNQGYYKDGQLTADNVNCLLEDIKKAKELGFNGCRVHQKIEDERFLYFADSLGFLIWNEMPSMYDCNESSKLVFTREWQLILEQLYNHPSIITWVPFNESWGCRYIKKNKEEQKFVNNVYKLTKKYDPYRFCITNDGWEHTISDIVTFHHYEQDGDKLNSHLKTLDKMLQPHIDAHERGLFANGYKYSNQPIMISEFGGTAYVDNTNKDNWGYGQAVKDDDQFVGTFKKLVTGLQDIPFIVGYCYTQLSDVQQEINGLLDVNHKYKVSPNIIKEIQDRRK